MESLSGLNTEIIRSELPLNAIVLAGGQTRTLQNGNTVTEDRLMACQDPRIYAFSHKVFPHNQGSLQIPLAIDAADANESGFNGSNGSGRRPAFVGNLSMSRRSMPPQSPSGINNGSFNISTGDAPVGNLINFMDSPVPHSPAHQMFDGTFDVSQLPNANGSPSGAMNQVGQCEYIRSPQFRPLQRWPTVNLRAAMRSPTSSSGDDSNRVNLSRSIGANRSGGNIPPHVVDNILSNVQQAAAQGNLPPTPRVVPAQRRSFLPRRLSRQISVASPQRVQRRSPRGAVRGAAQAGRGTRRGIPRQSRIPAARRP